MKIDALWLKMLGVMAVLNLVYWALSATILDFSNTLSDSVLFSIYVAPAILPVAPFAESMDSSSMFVPLVGALVILVLPLFWSLVLYGVVRAVRVIRNRMK
jgi:hypothetical protein